MPEPVFEKLSPYTRNGWTVLGRLDFKNYSCEVMRRGSLTVAVCVEKSRKGRGGKEKVKRRIMIPNVDFGTCNPAVYKYKYKLPGEVADLLSAICSMVKQGEPVKVEEKKHKPIFEFGELKLVTSTGADLRGM